jgi:hypothetical protein
MCDALFTNNGVSDIILNFETDVKIRINYFPDLVCGDYYAQ